MLGPSHFILTSAQMLPLPAPYITAATLVDYTIFKYEIGVVTIE